MPKGKNSINVGGGVVPRSVGIYSRPKCSNCVESRPLRPRRPRPTPGPDGQLEGAGRRPPTLRPCVPAASPARPEPWNDGSRRISESAPRGPQTVPLAGRPARSPRATRGVRVSGRGVRVSGRCILDFRRARAGRQSLRAFFGRASEASGDPSGDSRAGPGLLRPGLPPCAGRGLAAPGRRGPAAPVPGRRPIARLRPPARAGYRDPRRACSPGRERRCWLFILMKRGTRSND